jgi:hypothetical protein
MDTTSTNKKGHAAHCLPSVFSFAGIAGLTLGKAVDMLDYFVNHT